MAFASRVRAVPFAVGLALLSMPGEVAAHGTGVERFEAPLPLPLLLAGAGATVAVTAFVLALRPSVAERELEVSWRVKLPASAIPVFKTGIGVGFTTIVVLGLLGGVTGRQVAAENPATVLVWAVWIHGVAILAIFVGSPWSMMSPWRCIYRGLSKLEGERLAIAGAYPTRLGAWPALIGFVLLIGIVENLTVIPRSPQLTTALIAVYALAMVVGSTLWGDPWLVRADPLGLFYRLLGRIAPIKIESNGDDQSVSLRVRAPWRGTLTPVSGLTTVAFIVAAVYVVSFDGLAETAPFQILLFAARRGLGTGSMTSVLLFIAGLAGFLGLFWVSAYVADRLASGDDPEWRAATVRLAPTLLPIAAAYEIAHTYPYVAWNLGRLPRALLPSVGAIEPLSWLSVPAFWGSQVVLILAGHIVAVVGAHRVCTDRYETPRNARRGHLPLVVLMVGFTVLSLWIVSQPVVGG